MRPSSSMPRLAAKSSPVPARRRSWFGINRFAAARIIATVCSAVETVGASGAMHTAIPRAVAAATSTLS